MPIFRWSPADRAPSICLGRPFDRTRNEPIADLVLTMGTSDAGQDVNTACMIAVNGCCWAKSPLIKARMPGSASGVVRYLHRAPCQGAVDEYVTYNDERLAIKPAHLVDMRHAYSTALCGPPSIGERLGRVNGDTRLADVRRDFVSGFENGCSAAVVPAHNGSCHWAKRHGLPERLWAKFQMLTWSSLITIYYLPFARNRTTVSQLPF
jgi:hypothetical protein